MKNKLYNLFLVLFLTRILESDAFLIEKKLSAKLQKVKETNLNNYFTSPESKLVKVGIGTNNFESYEWDKASIYGTSEFEVYNNTTYIESFEANYEIQISMDEKIFELKNSKGKVIEKVSCPIIFSQILAF